MDKRVEHLTTLIKELVLSSKGRISYTHVDKELDITTPEEKTLRRVVFRELCDKSLVRRDEKLSGVYWRIDEEAPLIDWQKADPTNVIKLQFPFKLERYVKIFPKTIIIVAGEKQAGKTLFLFTFTLLNMEHSLGVDLFNNETGKEQMKERLDNFSIKISNPPPFRALERYDNFADVIDPNKISVIDYLDTNSEVYEVGVEIDRIFRKLQKGIAVIGLQTPPPSHVFVKGREKWVHRDLAYGGGFTAKRAALYLRLAGNTLKIVYCKTPSNPTVNANNKQWKYQINKTGTEFIHISDMEEIEQDELL